LRHISDVRDISLGIEGFAFNKDLAFVGIKYTRDHADEGGLACAVGSQQAKDGPFIKIEADIVHRALGGEVFLQVTDLEDIHITTNIMTKCLSFGRAAFRGSWLDGGNYKKTLCAGNKSSNLMDYY